MKNALELLKEDHQKVKKLLNELTETTTRAVRTRPQLLADIEHELKVHTRIEEEIFYPAFKAAGGSDHKEMNFEALEEHRAVDELVLPDLKNTDPTSEQFSGRAKVLKELVEHHADEEEDEMFKMAKKALSDEELRSLGERMSARKQELQEEMSK
jgi:hemerythrin-like domain-containing protein